VDVPLRNRSLRVTGPHLDVDLRVPGRRLVGEGCVAEVVERPEGTGDPDLSEGWLQIGPRESARVEGSPRLGVAEDQFVLALEGAPLPMLPQQLQGAVPDLEQPFGGLRLRCGETPSDKSFPDVDQPLKEAGQRSASSSPRRIAVPRATKVMVRASRHHGRRFSSASASSSW